MTSHISVIHTGVIDECLMCGEPIEFNERAHVFAWRHMGSYSPQHDASPEQPALRDITDRFLEERRKGLI